MLYSLYFPLSRRLSHKMILSDGLESVNAQAHVPDTPRRFRTTQGMRAHGPRDPRSAIRACRQVLLCLARTRLVRRLLDPFIDSCRIPPKVLLCHLSGLGGEEALHDRHFLRNRSNAVAVGVVS